MWWWRPTRVSATVRCPASGHEQACCVINAERTKLLPGAMFAVVKDGEDGERFIAACLVTTPSFEVKISQIWGCERAQANPVLEGWTAPLTW